MKMLSYIDAGISGRVCPNTKVECSDGDVKVWLYDTLIYRRTKDGLSFYNSGGYHTQTTRSRLEVLGAHIVQRHWRWYDGNTGDEWVDQDTENAPGSQWWFANNSNAEAVREERRERREEQDVAELATVAAW